MPALARSQVFPWREDELEEAGPTAEPVAESEAAAWPTSAAPSGGTPDREIPDREMPGPAADKRAQEPRAANPAAPHPRHPDHGARPREAPSGALIRHDTARRRAPYHGVPQPRTVAPGRADRPDVETQDFRPDELSRVADPIGDAPEKSTEDRLHSAARAFQQPEIRDEIADVLLEFCAPYFRRLVLIRRQGRVVGWCGEGEGMDPEMVRGIEIKADEPSIFLGINESSFWLGPLPRLPPNESLILGLDGPRPKDCAVLPITLLGKIVCYLYGDNLDGGVDGAPIAELRSLAAKAAVAFELYILKNKIRMI